MVLTRPMRAERAGRRLRDCSEKPRRKKCARVGGERSDFCGSQSANSAGAAKPPAKAPTLNIRRAEIPSRERVSGAFRVLVLSTPLCGMRA
jgi:hypothetical protein